jgi:hypothetical protein
MERGIDRIVAIDRACDEFAARNGAPELTRESVTGRPLFEYVSGRETQEIVRLLFARARSPSAATRPPAAALCASI